MKLGKFIRKIFFWEILGGLWLTLKTGANPKNVVTRQYPEEPRQAMPGFRGLHALVRESSTGREKCIACGLCAAVCPSQCITIYTGESPDGRKIAERYEIDVLRCVFCAFCVEACPVGAVVLTEHYEYSDYSREAFLMDKERLLDNWDKYMAGDKGKFYLKNFWRPMARDFGEYEGQPVFRMPKKEQAK
ncbi:NADH-quinone oxidoreductase subunit NuoI [Nitrospirota bacterium]